MQAAEKAIQAQESPGKVVLGDVVQPEAEQSQLGLASDQDVRELRDALRMSRDPSHIEATLTVPSKNEVLGAAAAAVKADLAAAGTPDASAADSDIVKIADQGQVSASGASGGPQESSSTPAPAVVDAVPDTTPPSASLARNSPRSSGLGRWMAGPARVITALAASANDAAAEYDDRVCHPPPTPPRSPASSTQVAPTKPSAPETTPSVPAADAPTAPSSTATPEQEGVAARAAMAVQALEQRAKKEQHGASPARVAHAAGVSLQDQLVRAGETLAGAAAMAMQATTHAARSTVESVSTATAPLASAGEERARGLAALTSEVVSTTVTKVGEVAGAAKETVGTLAAQAAGGAAVAQQRAAETTVSAARAAQQGTAAAWESTVELSATAVERAKDVAQGTPNAVQTVANKAAVVGAVVGGETVRLMRSAVQGTATVVGNTVSDAAQEVSYQMKGGDVGEAAGPAPHGAPLAPEPASGGGAAGEGGTRAPAEGGVSDANAVAVAAGVLPPSSGVSVPHPAHAPAAAGHPGEHHSGGGVGGLLHSAGRVVNDAATRLGAVTATKLHLADVPKEAEQLLHHTPPSAVSQAEQATHAPVEQASTTAQPEPGHTSPVAPPLPAETSAPAPPSPAKPAPSPKSATRQRKGAVGKERLVAEPAGKSAGGAGEGPATPPLGGLFAALQRDVMHS